MSDVRSRSSRPSRPAKLSTPSCSELLLRDVGHVDSTDAHAEAAGPSGQLAAARTQPDETEHLIAELLAYRLIHRSLPAVRSRLGVALEHHQDQHQRMLREGDRAELPGRVRHANAARQRVLDLRMVEARAEHLPELDPGRRTGVDHLTRCVASLVDDDGDAVELRRERLLQVEQRDADVALRCLHEIRQPRIDVAALDEIQHVRHAYLRRLWSRLLARRFGVLTWCKARRSLQAPPKLVNKVWFLSTIFRGAARDAAGRVWGVPTMQPILTNVERATAYMREARIDAVIAWSPSNVRYLTGYSCWLEPLFKEFMVQPGGAGEVVQRSYCLQPLAGDPCLVVEPLWAVDGLGTWVEDVRAPGQAGAAASSADPDLPLDVSRILGMLGRAYAPGRHSLGSRRGGARPRTRLLEDRDRA